MSARLSLRFAYVFALVAAAPQFATPSSVRGQRGASGTSAARADGDEMRVEGLLGSLPRSAARAAIARKQSRFVACFAARSTDVDVLGGRLDLVFRVAVDGSVKNVKIAHSTVGDRETERCVRTEAATVRFPAPEGGEAEVTDSIDVPLSADIRPPTAWQPTRVTNVVRALSSARRSCRVGSGALEITVYVGPGGDVLAAGAASPDDVSDAAVDCVLGRVRSASFPDPGSYPAKVGFSL